MLTLITLCWEFFKTGLFSIGGGLATLPFLFKISERYNWYTVSELTNMVAVSESTPGPIGVNMATYTGSLITGPIGGILATLSLVFPSVVVIIFVAQFLEKFSENKLVKDVFYGLRPAVVGMLLSSILTVFESSLFKGDFMTGFDIRYWGLLAVLIFGIFKFKKHPILYIGIGAVAGIILGF